MRRSIFAVLAALTLMGCAGCGSGGESSAGEDDYDLTGLNANMMYGQINDMTVDPDKYRGKSMKITGNFNYYQDPAQKEYFSVFVPDAAACCSQGIEFELSGEHTYPQDYPEIGAPITVAGVFDAYDEYGVTYCILHDAVMIGDENEETSAE